MEPVTHFLTGACIGRAGLNRKTAYATLTAALAAEAADMDIFWGLRGQVDELKHHRGITHTFIAVRAWWWDLCGCCTGGARSGGNPNWKRSWSGTRVRPCH